MYQLTSPIYLYCCYKRYYWPYSSRYSCLYNIVYPNSDQNTRAGDRSFFDEDIVSYIIVTRPFPLSCALSFELTELTSHLNRNSVPITAIFALINWEPFFSYSPFNPTWHAVMPTTLSQIILGTSILTACIPSLKCVLEAFRFGVGTISAITTAYKLGNSNLGSRPKSSTRAGSTKGLSSNATASGGRNWGGEKL